MKQEQLNINTPVKSDIKAVILGMLAKSTNGVVKMAPGVAQRILDEMNFKGQRNVREARVIKHQTRISSGLWKASFPVTIVILPTGEMWLVDGQHRLTAIARNSQSWPVTVILAKAESEQDARRLYAGFDEPDSKRSAHEVIDAVGLSDELGLPRAFTSRLFAAMPILRNSLEPLSGCEIEAGKYVRLFGTDARLSDIGEWKKEAEQYFQALKKTTGKIRAKMNTAGVMSVALYTFRYQPAKAHQFWHGLAENDGLRRDDPRATLLRDMMERTANTGSNRQTVQVPAAAWNAFCEGRPLKIIKCITGAPLTVWGTPVQGRAK